VGINGVISFFSHFLLFNTLLPISLIVTLEIVKVVQAVYIYGDMKMYTADRDRGAKVSSTSIIEELGQVDYIFSDKTGTLTRNVMEFKLLHVGKELYGDPKDLEVQLGYAEDAAPLKRDITHTDTHTGLEYAFKSDKLDKVLRNQDFSEINYEVRSSKGTIRLNYKT